MAQPLQTGRSLCRLEQTQETGPYQPIPVHKATERCGSEEGKAGTPLWVFGACEQQQTLLCNAYFTRDFTQKVNTSLFISDPDFS